MEVGIAAVARYRRGPGTQEQPAGPVGEQGASTSVKQDLVDGPLHEDGGVVVDGPAPAPREAAGAAPPSWRALRAHFERRSSRAASATPMPMAAGPGPRDPAAGLEAVLDHGTSASGPGRLLKTTTRSRKRSTSMASPPRARSSRARPPRCGRPAPPGLGWIAATTSWDGSGPGLQLARVEPDPQVPLAESPMETSPTPGTSGTAAPAPLRA